MDRHIWERVGEDFQENVIPEVNLRGSDMVKKEPSRKRMQLICDLGQITFSFIFCNMKLMHTICKSMMSHETKMEFGPAKMS